MGNEKTTSTKQQQAKATPEETELNKLLLEQTRATQGRQIQAQQQGLNLVNQLLTGGSLPGYLNQLPGGISEDVISSISQRAINDIKPSFQASGILDSGVAAEISARTSSDIRNQAAQFNIQNLLQLLNLGVGGQAQVQQPLLAQQGQLSGNLAGLRSVNTNQKITQMNPFLKSLQTSFGEGLGGTAGKGIGSFFIQ